MQAEDTRHHGNEELRETQKGFTTAGSNNRTLTLVLRLWIAHSVPIHLPNTSHSQFPMFSRETQEVSQWDSGITWPVCHLVPLSAISETKHLLARQFWTHSRCCSENLPGVLSSPSPKTSGATTDVSSLHGGPKGRKRAPRSPRAEGHRFQGTLLFSVSTEILQCRGE